MECILALYALVWCAMWQTCTIKGHEKHRAATYYPENQWVMWRTKVVQIMHFWDKLTGICRSRI